MYLYFSGFLQIFTQSKLLIQKFQLCSCYIKHMGTTQSSKRFILLGNLLLLLLLVNSSDVNSQEKGDLKLKSPIISDANGTKISNEFHSNSVELTQVKKEDKSKIIQKDLGKSNVESLQSNEGDDQKIKNDGIKNLEVKNKDDDEGGKSGGSVEGVGSKNEPKKDGNEESNGSLMGIEKSKLRDDECDPTNMCVDEKKNLTACLRVPANDSPDLTLLIQNKGAKPVTVTITAPEYVQLEETKVHLQQKEDKKVKVLAAYEAMDSLISLTTEDSRCIFDFKELIPHDSGIETHYTFNLRSFYNSTKTYCIIFLTLSAFAVFGSVWMYSGLYKKFSPGNGYQTIETELPVSGVSKISRESQHSG